MRIFITGASGYIGNSVARAFRRAGHDVNGLVRSDEKAKRLWADEIRPVVGDLKNAASYRDAANTADVIVHCAADMTSFSDTDKMAVEGLLAVAKEGNRARSFVYTSGVWVYGNTGMNRVNETTPLTNPAKISAWRPAVEETVLRASGDRLSTAVLRPGCVYGGKGSLTGMWFDSAEKEGAARIVGDGNNRWAVVHVEDLADAYVRTVHARVRGEVFNVTDRSRYTVRECAAAAARAAGKGGEVRSVPLADAQKQMNIFADALALDQHVESWKAVHVLGWNPRFGGFAEDAELFYQAWKNAAR